MLASAGAALVLAGFFSDWFDGTAEFAAQDFSGFDLARLIRNLEIVRPEDEGKLRVAAVVMYMMPALAVNAGVLAWPPAHPLLSLATSSLAAVYAAILLAALLLLSATGLTDLGGVLGAPEGGFWASVVGVLSLAAAATLQLRSRAAPAVRE
ncbi:MAG TPA: hypothetical protein VMR52_02890 [Dehalococcoidia bacterium]|nr:hypothetical protein [Dehalococcoidia bacterium]